MVTQCIREFVYTYGRYTGHNEVGIAVVQRRSDSTNPYWLDFVRTPSDDIAPWMKLFNAWQATLPAFAKTYKQTFMHLAKWLRSFDPQTVENVNEFMSTQNRNPSFFQYILALPANKSPRGTTFIQTLTYARRFSEFVAIELSLGGPERSFFHLVSEADLRSAKEHSKSPWQSHAGRRGKISGIADAPLSVDETNPRGGRGRMARQGRSLPRDNCFRGRVGSQGLLPGAANVILVIVRTAIARGSDETPR